jgi:uncharacterized protein (DUF302 family)
VPRWVVLLAILSCRPLLADQSFLQESCNTPFPEAMTLLQEAIVSRGYTVSRVQHVDKGLRLRGYETGLYRVVFFGRPQQMAWVRLNYPALMSYLPMKITLFEDEGHVVASALQPATLSSFFEEEKIQQLLSSWQKDVTTIMAFYGRCGETTGYLEGTDQLSISNSRVGK